MAVTNWGWMIAGLACVGVFLALIAAGWLASVLDRRQEARVIRDEWAEITRAAEPVPETGWSHVPVTAEEATVAFIAYLAERTDTWLSEHTTGAAALS